MSAPVQRWAKAGEFRPWAREERQAYDALVQARETGDPVLIAEAQRAHRETLGRMPTCALRRRRR
jgi:hypothetical protein